MPKGSLINDLNNKLLQEKVNYDIEKLKIENKSLVQNLNNEQLYIYEEILNTITSETNNLFFICGPVGTGKTYLWNAIISKIRSDNKIVLTVASLEITSLLLPMGRTSQSRFRISLLIDKSSTGHIKKRNPFSKLNRENFTNFRGRSIDE